MPRISEPFAADLTWQEQEGLKSIMETNKDAQTKSESPAVLADRLREYAERGCATPRFQLFAAADRIACVSQSCGQCLTCIQREQSYPEREDAFARWAAAERRAEAVEAELNDVRVSGADTFQLRGLTLWQMVHDEGIAGSSWKPVVPDVRVLLQAEVASADLRARLEQLTCWNVNELEGQTGPDEYGRWVRWADVQAALAREA